MNEQSITYRQSIACKLLIPGCGIPIPDRLLGKIVLQRSILEAVVDAGFEPLAISFEHAQFVRNLRTIHKDSMFEKKSGRSALGVSDELVGRIHNLPNHADPQLETTGK